MNVWYAQMAQIASETIGRFMADDPANPVEEAVFKMVREVIDRIGAVLNGFLARVKGPVTI